MATVNVVSVAAYRWFYWLKLIGLVQRSVPGARATFSQMNRVNFRNYCAMMTAA